MGGEGGKRVPGGSVGGLPIPRIPRKKGKTSRGKQMTSQGTVNSTKMISCQFRPLAEIAGLGLAETSPEEKKDKMRYRSEIT